MNPRYHMVGIDMRRTCERVQANTRSGVAIAQLSLLGNPQAVQAGDDVNASWLGAAATAKLGATDTDFDHTSRKTIMHIIAEQVSSRVLRCGNCPMPLAHSLLSRNDAVGIGSAPAPGAAGRALAARIGASPPRTHWFGRKPPFPARGRAGLQPGRLRSPSRSTASFRLGGLAPCGFSQLISNAPPARPRAQREFLRRRSIAF
jgi:hypothetical protein